MSDSPTPAPSSSATANRPEQRSRTPKEQRQFLEDEVKILRLFCDQFDSGNYLIANKMAVSIYTMLRDESKRRRALINRFDLTPKFLNVHNKVSSENVMAAFPGLSIRMDTEAGSFKSTARYVANLGEGPSPFRQWIAQSKWWDQIIIRDRNRRSLSRKQIIFWGRNQDGGAHAAPYVDVVLDELSNGSSLGWQAALNDQIVPWACKPGQAQLRQLAFEAVETVTEFLAPSEPGT